MLMDKDYRKTEGILYSYYRKKKRLSRLEYDLGMTMQTIDRIQKDLKEVNVDIEDCVRGIDYSGDRVQTSSTVSIMERELIRITDKLLNELKYRVQKKYKLKARIRCIQEDVLRLQKVLDDLAEEELQIVELKYADCKTLRDMEKIFAQRGTPLSSTSIWRKRDKIIEYIHSQL